MKKTTGKEPVGNSAARPWDCHVRKICQNPPSMLCPWSYIIPFNRRNETFIRVYILFLTLWSRWLSSCSVDDSIYLSLSLSLYTYSFFFLVNNSHHLFHWVSILSYLSWPFAVFFFIEKEKQIKVRHLSKIFNQDQTVDSSLKKKNSNKWSRRQLSAIKQKIPTSLDSFRVPTLSHPDDLIIAFISNQFPSSLRLSFYLVASWPREKSLNVSFF